MIGSLGVPEILFILVLALLVFGPKRLPEIGRTVGKGLAEFRKASNELKRTINAELALEDPLADTDIPLTRPRKVQTAAAVPSRAPWEDDPAAVLAAEEKAAAADLAEVAEADEPARVEGQAVVPEALDPK
jgi:sec-independent protein translocase protein TatA